MCPAHLGEDDFHGHQCFCFTSHEADQSTRRGDLSNLGFNEAKSFLDAIKSHFDLSNVFIMANDVAANVVDVFANSKLALHEVANTLLKVCFSAILVLSDSSSEPENQPDKYSLKYEPVIAENPYM